MGGIAGTFHRDGRLVTPGQLARQSAVLAHRGPVGDSVWFSGPIGFVHRITAVAPQVSPRGQPLTDTSGRFAIVCNGRIFNAPEIAALLEANGVRLFGASILEVMLAAFVHWGVRAFARFNGSFACAVWDSSRQRLVLARDHFGIKPLFYYDSGTVFLFGSEVKSVLTDPQCAIHPDEHGIANYLSFNRYLVASEKTFYRKVSKLLPAHVLIADKQGVRLEPYWEFDVAQAESGTLDAESLHAATELMTDAVRIRLPAPGARIGAALTGGYDSSSIVCLIHHLNRHRPAAERAIDTFSWDFGSADADELDLIEAVALTVGARHHHIAAVTPTLFEELDGLIAANDGPVLESGMLLLWKKKRAVCEAGVGVQLSGCGGDELFLGTMHYLADLMQQARWRELSAEVASVYPIDKSTGKTVSLAHLLRAYVLAPLAPAWSRRLLRANSGQFFTGMGRQFPPPWLSGELAARAGFDRGLPPASTTPRFKTAYSKFTYDLLWYDMAGCYIQNQEVASSAFGLDTRFPFLDIRLVESMLSLPRQCKVKLGEVRILQKAALAHVLPEAIRQSHVKKNFHPTLHRLTRQHYLDELAGLFKGNQQKAREYFNWPMLRRHYDQFRAHHDTNPAPLWGLLNIERWLRSI